MCLEKRFQSFISGLAKGKICRRKATEKNAARKSEENENAQMGLSTLMS
jgi:hypothetical protein